jgi:putative endonuclease
MTPSHAQTGVPAAPAIASSTTATGRAAEQLAADYLAARGFTVLDRNWRNRWCELDIVARLHGQTTHFVEVKYRRSTAYGYAAEYISADKLARLQRAALAWNQAHRYLGPYQIDVVTVEGALDHPRIVYLPNITGV